jgi:Tn3 transposase DDE domain
MDDAVNHLRRDGREISDEHLARLSPLQYEHVLMLGTFPFTLPHELAADRRRALRIGDGAA